MSGVDVHRREWLELDSADRSLLYIDDVYVHRLKGIFIFPHMTHKAYVDMLYMLQPRPDDRTHTQSILGCRVASWGLGFREAHGRGETGPW